MKYLIKLKIPIKNHFVYKKMKRKSLPNKSNYLNYKITNQKKINHYIFKTIH